MPNKYGKERDFEKQFTAILVRTLRCNIKNFSKNRNNFQALWRAKNSQKKKTERKQSII